MTPQYVIQLDPDYVIVLTTASRSQSFAGVTYRLGSPLPIPIRPGYGMNPELHTDQPTALSPFEEQRCAFFRWVFLTRKQNAHFWHETYKTGTSTLLPRFVYGPWCFQRHPVRFQKSTRL